jgi:hypothetical protein
MYILASLKAVNFLCSTQPATGGPICFLSNLEGHTSRNVYIGFQLVLITGEAEIERAFFFLSWGTLCHVTATFCGPFRHENSLILIWEPGYRQQQM